MQKRDMRQHSLPLLALTNSIGLVCISLAFYFSVLSYPNLAIEASFFFGLLLMFVPSLLRLLSPECSRFERLCLLCMLSLYFYLIQFMVSPLHFFSFDDFLHWRTVADILRTGHLFSTNSMLPASSYYPGLEIVTDSISTMTRLSPFYASILIICASHILMMGALFLLYEQVTHSSRLASIGTLVYMLNPHFLFFDSTFSYETLALPLATFLLYILARFENSHKDYRWLVFTAWLVLAAVTITHHMTDYVFVGLLILWAIVSLLRPSSRVMRMRLISIALWGALLALAYAFLLPGNPVWVYLSGYYQGAFKELGRILAGVSVARPIFSGTSQPIPIWDSLLRTACVAFITFSIPFGLVGIWRRYRNNALAVMLGIFSLVYPITQVFRFTTFGSEITDRAAAFLFVSVACILAIVLALFWPRRKLKRRSIALITVTLSVLLVGGTLIAIGSNHAVLPGPYAVVADGLSIEPEGIEAAKWSRTKLGPDNLIGTDRINQMLMSTYGDQRVVTRLSDNVDIAPIFYSQQLGPNEISLMRYGRIHYLVVDLRLSTSAPLLGLYFENDQPARFMSREALAKFDSVGALNRLFDSGNIIIYDAGELTNGFG